MTSGRTSTTASNDDVALVLARGDVDLGRGDDVDLVLGDRLRRSTRGGRAGGRRPGRLGADAGLEELAGRLAGPEPGDADLPGDALEGGVDLLVELGLVDLDARP